MRGFAFRTGLTFDWSGVAHRVERLGIDDQIVLERQTDGQVVLSSRPNLLVAFADGAIKVKPSTSQPVVAAVYRRPLTDLPDTVQSELRRRLAYLQVIDSEGVHSRSERHLKPLIAKVAKWISDSSPPSWITVYRWHRKYRFEREPRSLIPCFDRRGSSVVRQPDRVLELFALAVEEAFKASPEATVQSIHTRLAGKIDAENRNRLPEDHQTGDSARRCVFSPWLLQSRLAKRGVCSQLILAMYLVPVATIPSWSNFMEAIWRSSCKVYDFCSS